MKKVIIRKKYINKIKPFIDKPIIKVITGQRRTGKSFILLQIINYLKKSGVNNRNIIYINKESDIYNSITNSDDLSNYIKKSLPKNKSKIYLFIDEIQEIKNFEKSIRNFNLNQKFDIYITGSNSNILSSDLATFLAGRYITFNIFPLDYTEFLKFHNLKQDQKSLKLYFKYGGMPFLRNLDLKDEIIFTYLSNIYNTIFLKDIVKRYSIRNVRLLEILISYLSDNIGNFFSASSISRYLKEQNVIIPPKVILNYLDYLLSSYLIQEAKKYDIKGKKIFKLNSKFYFNDLGIKNSIRQIQEFKPEDILENVIFMHLISNDFNVYVGSVDTNEIDFIAEKRNKKIYIQSTYLINDIKTKQREFGNLLKINDNYPKYVVSMDEVTRENVEGIYHINIMSFLTSPEFQ